MGQQMSTIPPPICQGVMVSSRPGRAYSAPMPVGPNTVCPDSSAATRALATVRPPSSR